ncbi:MAG: methyltransferase domain-containing protein [Planctomycetia bacterium]|nr:methyltransferase domain-containing protein [Planctomycetia bacterium]
MTNATATPTSSVVEAPALTTTPPPAGGVALAPVNHSDRFLTDRRTLALFLISVVGLFLELMLIRWVSTEIRIFAYLQNTVLVVCFLGLGMGCWDSRRAFALRDVLVPLTILVALLAIPTSRIVLGDISGLLAGVSDLLIWTGVERTSDSIVAPVVGAILTFGLMVLLWQIFVPIGRLLGRLMSDHPNTIAAYSVNVFGSLVGIWLFVLASALYLPPVLWFLGFVVAVIPLVGSGGKSKVWDGVFLTTILGLGILAGIEIGFQEVRWTPYQKLSVRDLGSVGANESPEGDRLRGKRAGAKPEPGRTFIGVNNTGYQATVDLRPEVVAADPVRFDPAQRGYSQYDIPMKLHPQAQQVLVVGAGSGNDAAGMLRNGAARVVAVEIDPGIIELGKRFHPEKPYDDPRCVVINDDARSYFATSTEQFDLIAFGLLDSHTTTAMTNARLDHYVYTQESINQVRSLLKPGGIAVLSFEVAKPYIADRMALVLRQAFGHEPVVFRVPNNSYGWGGVLFVMGDSREAVEARIAADPKLAELVKQWQATRPIHLTGSTRATTDDWPYLYLEKPSIPVLYFLLGVLLIGLYAFGRRVIGKSSAAGGWGRDGWHFFFLGAGFMLLEVQNISKAAVVLGNTWVVNAVIISGVMVMILLANLIAARFPQLPLKPVYALLVFSCIGLYFLDLSRFAFLPYAAKATVVGLLTSLPMLFSGIVFIRSFAAAERKDAALGANLIGALVGGLLQSVTFVTGIKALLLIVAVLYLAAILTRTNRETESANGPVGEPALS